ncbi:MAG: hypothetical protein MI749_15620, partial [Desulfovibrionales bacterium]|nr:hypothetical protein [Desulfovibrionales bacterium]
MNPVVERILTTLKELSLAKKIALGTLVLVIISGFVTMFVWNNKTQMQPAYTGLSKEDAAQVVAVLKENKTPYTLAGDGTTLLVAEDLVYEVRLTMAKQGIP